MQKLITMVAAGAALFAGAAGAKDSYPISGAITTTLTANHAELRPVEFADPGFFQGSLDASVFYQPTKKLFLSAGLSFFKNFDAGQEGQGTIGATTYGKAQIQDLGLSAAYSVAKFGPMVINAGLGVTVPLSENSRAVGLVTAISPSLSTQIKLPANFALQLAGGLTYNVNEDATQRIDCSQARFRDNCQISGSDLGNPNTLLTYGGAFGIVYLPVKGLVINARYSIGAGIGAVEFKEDEFTSEAAAVQNGTQYSGASHATRFTISYSLAGLHGGTDGVGAKELDPNIDPSLQMGGDSDAPFWTRFTLNLSMSTRDLVYARDRSEGVRFTIPVYDFETNTGERTLYALGISYNI